MASLRRRFARCLLYALVSISIGPAIASEKAFPFDRELMLDAAPMRGSKRVPILQIGENGAASIDLWCASTRGQANVGADIDHHRHRAGPARRAGAMRAGAAERRRESAGRARAGDELAAPRRRDRAPRRDHAALPADDQLKGWRDYTLTARVIRNGVDGVVFENVDGHSLELGAQLASFAGIVLQRRRQAWSAGQWSFPAPLRKCVKAQRRRDQSIARELKVGHRCAEPLADDVRVAPQRRRRRRFGARPEAAACGARRRQTCGR